MTTNDPLLNPIEKAFYKLFHTKVLAAKPSDVQVSWQDGFVHLVLTPQIASAFAEGTATLDMDKIIGDSQEIAADEFLRRARKMADAKSGNRPRLAAYMAEELKISLGADCMKEHDGSIRLTFHSIAPEALSNAASDYIKHSRPDKSPPHFS